MEVEESSIEQPSYLQMANNNARSVNHLIFPNWITVSKLLRSTKTPGTALIRKSGDPRRYDHLIICLFRDNKIEEHYISPQDLDKRGLHDILSEYDPCKFLLCLDDQGLKSFRLENKEHVLNPSSKIEKLFFLSK